ncbi:hypothetical protein [Actinoplanes sp. NPDC051859]|uniref:hypothetical protein n=1 Tax=Actinoplanes sp. NPDC051859 TaxID=3363909 RepID=UPI0037BDD05F
MTTVNWERESGEKVEEFVSALLLLDHDGPGNRITPSQGDRGVDVRLLTAEGFDIHQIKRFHGPLDAKQRAQVEKSWKTFVRDTLPILPVRSWSLTCPWDPTNERLEWLQDLTAGHDITVNWMGRTQLDVLAAQNLALVDYYFGDGGQRLHRLMTDVLQGGRDVPQRLAGEDLLDAVAVRHLSLSDALNEVDPFYRYEFEIRYGRVRDLELQEPGLRPATVFERYLQVDEERFQVLRILARHPSAPELHPISIDLRLEAAAGTPDQAAIEDFIQFGAPFDDLPATVTSITGPPGMRQPTGDGRFTFMVANDQAAERPDLEVRLVDSHGNTQRALPLSGVQVSRAPAGPGWWIAGRDETGVLEVGFFMQGPDGSDEVRITPRSLTGRTPLSVLPAMQLAAAMAEDVGLLLAVRGGPALTSVWHLEDSALSASARWHLRLLEALIEIQQHTVRRVTVPDVDTVPTGEINEILRVGRLLRGEQIEVSWTHVELTVTTPENLPPAGGTEFALMNTGPLTVALSGERIELDLDRRVLYRAARLAESTDLDGVEAGHAIRLLPGSDPAAIIAAVPREPDA